MCIRDRFDAWYEEDEPNVAHPRDPFHRIDIVHSSRTVRVELGGELLAESSAPYLLFEPPLPVRHYLPAADVRMDLLTPSDTRTFCAYKGEASYLSHAGEPDVAWYYPAPLREAAEVTGRSSRMPSTTTSARSLKNAIRSAISAASRSGAG